MKWCGENVQVKIIQEDGNEISGNATNFDFEFGSGVEEKTITIPETKTSLSFSFQITHQCMKCGCMIAGSKKELESCSNGCEGLLRRFKK